MTASESTLLTAERVRELFNCDYDTGILTVRYKHSANSVVGSVCGNKRADGYVKVSISYRKYAAHRIVWLHHYGAWPNGQIDHINGVRSDNRIRNLRDVLPSTNRQNVYGSTSRSTSKLLGAFRHSAPNNKPWKSSICFSGKTLFLGYFDTAEQAHEVYLEAKRRLHQGNML